jgi:ribonucleoside-diphosphate reductase alpha chain
VLAPTGTIAFMMDCDTTGVEPDIALVKYKKLVGGGLIKIVNNTVPLALKRLGYDKEEVRASSSTSTSTTPSRARRTSSPRSTCRSSTAPSRPARGSRSIHYMGHLKMLAAVQPFISGAISKTINMPEEATVDEIQEAYLEGWRLGLKAVAIYRDNCKRSQPLSTKKEGGKPAETAEPLQAVVAAPVAPSGRSAASCPTSGARSPTSSRSTATRGTSPSASTTTARRARSSSPWRRRARRSRA